MSEMPPVILLDSLSDSRVTDKHQPQIAGGRGGVTISLTNSKWIALVKQGTEEAS